MPRLLANRLPLNPVDGQPDTVVRADRRIRALRRNHASFSCDARRNTRLPAPASRARTWPHIAKHIPQAERHRHQHAGRGEPDRRKVHNLKHVEPQVAKVVLDCLGRFARRRGRADRPVVAAHGDINKIAVYLKSLSVTSKQQAVAYDDATTTALRSGHRKLH
jgi:hypothetical protein